MNGNGRLAVPGQVNVATTYVDGPLAAPTSLALQGPGGMQTIVMGGLTKVEQLAGQIAGNLRPDPSLGRNESELDQMLAIRSVNIAEAILAETARRRTPEPTE